MICVDKASEAIVFLASISKTEQDEEVEKMLCYYGVHGVIELQQEQITTYARRRKEEVSRKGIEYDERSNRPD